MEKLEIYINDNYILNDAFDQAVMNIHILKKQHNYKSFVLCGCEVRDGTTTVTISLASALAGSGFKTVLIDGDMRKKNRHKRLNESVKTGLSDYLMDKAYINDIIYETTTDNLFYIPSGELVNNPVRFLCSKKMEEVRDELSKSYDFILYDMPAVNAAMDAKVLAVSTDATILVSAIGKTAKSELIEAVNSLSEVNANLIGTIVNRISMKTYTSLHADYDYFKDEKYIVESRGAKTNRRKVKGKK